MPDSLLSHGLQHTRPPCPSPTPGAYSNSGPSSQWCHSTILLSVIPFPSRLQYFPASESIPMRQLLPSGGQSIGVSASPSVLPMNTQDWSPLGWTGWISLQSKGLSRVFSNIILQKHQFFGTQLSLVQLSHPYMTTGETTALTRRTCVGQVLWFCLVCMLLAEAGVQAPHRAVPWCCHWSPADPLGTGAPVSEAAPLTSLMSSLPFPWRFAFSKFIFSWGLIYVQWNAQILSIKIWFEVWEIGIPMNSPPLEI